MTETEVDTTESILQDIRAIQADLERLRLKVEQNRDTNNTEFGNTRGVPNRFRRRTGPLQIGEEVIIKNPKRGQEKFGTVEKIHVSGWVTIRGWKKIDGVRSETKIKRIRSNLVRKQN